MRLKDHTFNLCQEFVLKPFRKTKLFHKLLRKVLHARINAATVQIERHNVLCSEEPRRHTARQPKSGWIGIVASTDVAEAIDYRLCIFVIFTHPQFVTQGYPTSFRVRTLADPKFRLRAPDPDRHLANVGDES